MKSWMWLGLLLFGTAGVSPLLLQAQIFSDPCCQTCSLPIVQCHCQRTVPVVQNHVREEKVTTYRNVMETRYREECFVEHTPVTTYEDRIETVWVPQQVTKKVARTVMVPQTKSRTVPYQVMQHIPETTTRLVNYQTVHHVTETVPVATAIAPPVVTHAWVTPLPTSSPPAISTTIHHLPHAAGTPQKAPPLAPPTKTSSRGGWQTIPARSASASSDRYGGYESDYDGRVPTPTDDEPAFRRSTWNGHVPGAVAARNFSEQMNR